jgi:hypothetical protein
MRQQALKSFGQALEWPVIVGCVPVMADELPCSAPVFTMEQKSDFHSRKPWKTRHIFANFQRRRRICP